MKLKKQHKWQISNSAFLLPLASFNRRSEDIGVLTIVVPKLKFGYVQMQIFLAYLVISSNNAAFENRPEAFDCIGMNRANDMLANGVIDRLVREAALQTAIAGISIGAEKANAIGDGFAYESFKSVPVSTFNDTSDDITLALDCASYWRLASISAPSRSTFLVPMPVLIAAADVGFINLNDAAELFDVLDHGGSNLVAHEPSSLVRAEAHIAEDLEGTHALLANQHKVRDSIPIFQRLIRVLKDCAGQVRETITCGAAGGAYRALPMVAGGEGIDLEITAARARNAIRPAPDYKVRNAIVLSLKQRVELGRCHLMDCFRTGHTKTPLMARIMA
jgi:hypothetical protein